jgi:hypothetical protein
MASVSALTPSCWIAGKLPPQIATAATTPAMASPLAYWTGRLVGFMLVSGWMID